MLLVKNCFKKDNLISRKTIKLGTLFEYRKIESAQIVDSDEGKYTFHLKFDGTVDLEKKWFNLIFQGIISLGGEENYPRVLGSMTAHIDKLNMVGGDSRNIKVKDSAATVHREAFNCFIFCMSQIRKTTEANGMFPDYDDSWYLSATKAEALGAALSVHLRERILAGRRSGAHIVSPAVSLENLRIYCRHEPVSYIPRETHITGSGSFSADDFMMKIRDMALVKPPSFQHEKEYRFSFTIVAGDLILMPTVDNIILPAEDIAALAFTV